MPTAKKRRRFSLRTKTEPSENQVNYFLGVLKDPNINKPLRLLALTALKDLHRNCSKKQQNHIAESIRAIPEEHLQDFSKEELATLASKSKKQSKKRRRSDSHAVQETARPTKQHKKNDDPRPGPNDGIYQPLPIFNTPDNQQGPPTPSSQISTQQGPTPGSQDIGGTLNTTVSVQSAADTAKNIEISGLKDRVKSKKSTIKKVAEECLDTERNYLTQISAYSNLKPDELKAHYILHYEKKEAREGLSVEEKEQLTQLKKSMDEPTSQKLAQLKQADSLTPQEKDRLAELSKMEPPSTEESRELIYLNNKSLYTKSERDRIEQLENELAKSKDSGPISQQEIQKLSGLREQRKELIANASLDDAEKRELSSLVERIAIDEKDLQRRDELIQKAKIGDKISPISDQIQALTKKERFTEATNNLNELLDRKPMSTLTNVDDMIKLSELYGELVQAHQQLLTDFANVGEDGLGNPEVWQARLESLAELHKKVAIQYHQMNAEKANLPTDFERAFLDQNVDPNSEKGLAMDVKSCMTSFLQRSMRYALLADAYKNQINDLKEAQEQLQALGGETPEMVSQERLTQLSQASKQLHKHTLDASFENQDSRRLIDNKRLTDKINNFIFTPTNKRLEGDSLQALQELIKEYMYAKNTKLDYDKALAKYETDHEKWVKKGRNGVGPQKPRLEQITTDTLDIFENQTQFREEVLARLSQKEWKAIKKAKHEDQTGKNKSFQKVLNNYKKANKWFEQELKTLQGSKKQSVSLDERRLSSNDSPSLPAVEPSDVKRRHSFKEGVLKDRARQETQPPIISRQRGHSDPGEIYQALPTKALEAHRQSLESLGTRGLTRRPFHVRGLPPKPPELTPPPTQNDTGTYQPIPVQRAETVKSRADSSRVLKHPKAVDLQELGARLMDDPNVKNILPGENNQSLAIVLKDGAHIQLNKVEDQENQVRISIYNTTSQQHLNRVAVQFLDKLELEPPRPTRKVPQLNPQRPPVPMPRESLPKGHMAHIDAPLPKPLAGVREKTIYERTQVPFKQGQSLDDLISQMQQLQRNDANPNGEIANFSVLRDLNDNPRELIIRHKDLDTAIMITQDGDSLKIESPQNSSFDLEGFVNKLVNPKQEAQLDGPSLPKQAK